jgi:hypothetical protein
VRSSRSTWRSCSFIGALAIAEPKDDRLGLLPALVIIFGVTLGLLSLVVPMLYEVSDALRESMTRSAFARLEIGFGVLTLLGPVVVVALTWPWWLALLWLWAVPVVVLIYARVKGLM